MARKRRSEPSEIRRYRDPRTGRFVSPTKRKETIQETYFGTGAKFSETRGRFRTAPKKRAPRESGTRRVLFEGSHGKRRVSEIIAEEKLVNKLARSKSRVVHIELETFYKDGTRPIRRIKSIVLASKGKKLREQNRIILLKAMLHVFDGTGLKPSPKKKIAKKDRKRFEFADPKRTVIRVVTTEPGKRYRKPGDFESVTITKGIRRSKKQRKGS